MAITVAIIRPLRFSDGKSAVRLSAYCHKAVFVRDLTGERCGNFSSSNVVHEELVIPPSSAEWAHEKYPSSPEGAQRLWNDIEIHEELHNPCPTRICALELMIALPLELTLDENVSLSSTFARKSLTRRGYPLDLVVHDKPGNPHAHVIFAQRPALPGGWGSKHQYAHFARMNKDLRFEFVQTANVFLSFAGETKLLDVRKYAERGLRLAPVDKLGPPPANPSNHVVYTKRLARKESALEKNSDLMFSDIEELVKLAGTTTRLVNRQSLAEQAKRWIRFPSETDFHAYMQRVENSPSLVPVGREPATRDPVFASRYQIAVEHRLLAAAQSLLDLDPPSNGADFPKPTDQSECGGEQDQVTLAVRSITRAGRLALLSGFPGEERDRIKRYIQSLASSEGAGTVMVVPYEGTNFPAARNSPTERTVPALIYALRRKPHTLPSPFVACLDDAGLLEFWELADLLELMQGASGKLVLMDDYARREPIPARSAFSMLWETFGGIVSETFSHQKGSEAGSVSRLMASARPREALASLDSRDSVAFADDFGGACDEIARDYWAGFAPTLAIVPERLLVDALNRAIRAEGIRTGRIRGFRQTPAENGSIEFGRGDRVVTRSSVPELRVRPGMLGTVVAANGADSGTVEVLFDDVESRVGFSGPAATCLAPGFALDPKRARNQVLERVLFLATGHIDRNMAVTAFSRHRSQLRVYIDRSSFAAIEELAVCLNRAPAPPWLRGENERSAHSRQPGRQVHADGWEAGSFSAAPAPPASTRTLRINPDSGVTGPGTHPADGSRSPSPVSVLRRMVLARGSVTASELAAELALHSGDRYSIRNSADDVLDHDETVVLVPGSREFPDSFLTTLDRLRLDETIVSAAYRIRRHTLRDCLRREPGASGKGFPDGPVNDILSGSALAVVDGPDRSGMTETACSLVQRLSELGTRSVSLVVDDDRAVMIRHRIPENATICAPGDVRGLEPADCYVLDAAETVGATDMASLLGRAERDRSAVVMFGNALSSGHQRGSPWRLLTDRFPARNLFEPVSRSRPGGISGQCRFIPEQASFEQVLDKIVPSESRFGSARTMDVLVLNAANDFIADPARGKIVLAATRAQAAAINREILDRMGNRPDASETRLADGSPILLAGGDPVRVVKADPGTGIRDNQLAEVVVARDENLLLDLDPFGTNETENGGPRFMRLRADCVVLDHAFADTIENSAGFPGSRHLVFSPASRGQSIRYALSCGGPSGHIHVLDEDPTGFLSKMINTTGWTNPMADLASIGREAWQRRLPGLAPRLPDRFDPALGDQRPESGIPVGACQDDAGVVNRLGNERALNAWLRLAAMETAMEFGETLKERSAPVDKADPGSGSRPGRTSDTPGAWRDLVSCFCGEGNRLVVEAMDTRRAGSRDGLADRPDLDAAEYSRNMVALAVAFTEIAPPGHVGHKLDIHSRILGMTERITWPDGNWLERAIADLRVFEVLRGLPERRTGQVFGRTVGKARMLAMAATGSGVTFAEETVARLFTAAPGSWSTIERDIVRILQGAVEERAVRHPDELFAARSEFLDSMLRARPDSRETRDAEVNPGVRRPLFTAHEMRALMTPGAELPGSLPDLPSEHRRRVAGNIAALGERMSDTGRQPFPGLHSRVQEGFSW
ncbi:MAG: MobA/MobL family protein [Rhodobacteraceae bacterium]|nr:MobA/MobL family protein [Paracoccaceae bacterium]